MAHILSNQNASIVQMPSEQNTLDIYLTPASVQWTVIFLTAKDGAEGGEGHASH